jgi:hypothetical protein
MSMAISLSIDFCISRKRKNLMNPQVTMITMITKRLLPLMILCVVASLIAKVMSASGAAQTPDSVEQDRNLKVKEFKDMPITVREVRHLKKDTWYKDLEIEVKNVSKKPIYMISGDLSLPDTTADSRGDGSYGIPLLYNANKNIWDRAEPGDPHIDPGEVYVFKIPEDLQRGLKEYHQTMPWLVKRLKLSFPLISFGDGTGFEATRFVDYRNGRPR